MGLIPNVECVINKRKLQTAQFSTEYNNRHIRVGHYIHWKICQHYKAPYIRTGTNINQNLLLKQRAPQYFGISEYIQIEKLVPINLILQLKVIKKTSIYWLSRCFLLLKASHLENLEKYQNTRTFESKQNECGTKKPTLIPGSSWYSKNRYKRIFTTIHWKAKPNRNAEYFTNKHCTYSEKNVVNLNQ